jgi:hypothetical protein
MSLSPEQIAALEAPLNRANVKARKQAGREVSYIESWHAESEANRIFGFDGWDSQVMDLRLVSEREVIIGKGGQYEKPGWSVSYVCTVRVPVWNGERVVIRDGVGAGHGIDADPGQAHESAVKEAASDAEKRALKTWGNQFGLALYDKTQANVESAPAAQSRPREPAPAKTVPTEPSTAVTAATAAISMCATSAELKAWWEDHKERINALPDPEYLAISEVMRAKTAELKPKAKPAPRDDFGLNGDQVPAAFN